MSWALLLPAAPAGPAIAWRPGRSDKPDGSSSPPDGRLPDASQVRPPLHIHPDMCVFRGASLYILD